MRLNSALKCLIFLSAPFPGMFWIHGWIHAAVRIIIPISSFCGYHLFKSSSVKLHTPSAQKAPMLKSTALALCHSQQPQSRVTEWQEWGWKAVATQQGSAQPCRAVLSQVCCWQGSERAAWSWALLPPDKVDVLHVRVICDAGFPIFRDSSSFFVVENRGWRTGEKSLDIKLFYSSLLCTVWFGFWSLVYFILTVGKDKIACFGTCVNIISRKCFVCSSLHDWKLQAIKISCQF